MNVIWIFFKFTWSFFPIFYFISLTFLSNLPPLTFRGVFGGFCVDLFSVGCLKRTYLLDLVLILPIIFLLKFYVSNNFPVHSCIFMVRKCLSEVFQSHTSFSPFLELHRDTANVWSDTYLSFLKKTLFTIKRLDIFFRFFVVMNFIICGH